MCINQKHVYAIFFSLLLSSCSLAQSGPNRYQPKIATIGAAGSLHGPHYIASMLVTDVNGWSAELGYGAIDGEAVASADIGISVPKRIEGYWQKETSARNYYKIKANIDSLLAAKKVQTLKHYYRNFHASGTLAVTVDGPNVMLYYTLSCSPRYDDCTPRENADPNHYIVHSTKYGTNRVVLYQGKGQSSKIPFANSPFDKRMVDLDIEHSHAVDYMSVSDNQGHHAGIANYIATPTHITAFWRTYGRDPNGRRDSRKDLYHRVSARLDPKIMEAKIQTMRAYYKYYRQNLGRVVIRVNNDQLSVSYTIFCSKGIDDCQPKPSADPNHWVTQAPYRNTDIVQLFQGQGETSTTPFPDGPDYSKGRPYVLKSPSKDPVNIK